MTGIKGSWFEDQNSSRVKDGISMAGCENLIRKAYVCTAHNVPSLDLQAAPSVAAVRDKF